MDWKQLGLSSLAVFGLLLLAGTIISLLSSQLQCSKISVSESFKQGSIFAFLPTLVYSLGAAFAQVRTPFSRTLTSFGIPEDSSSIMGVGYITMITAWVSAVWAIHTIEKNVCKPDVNEMTAFKTKMLAELQQKELDKEKQAQKS
jgi:cytochrome c biogenesis factor